MKKIDFHHLDGQLLRTFLIILEESSVSRAAERLNVTQSAVSHTLAKVRGILGDPLFVRSGQGLTPTETALSLKAPVRAVLDGMQALTNQRGFDPKSEPMHFVVAANDMQRNFVFPDLVRQAWQDGIQVTFDFKPSGVPNLSLLRDARCDLLLTPVPPEAVDMIQSKLFDGRVMCFFDGDKRKPPEDIDSYLAADHVAVQFASGGSSAAVLTAPELPEIPPPAITVPNFAGIAPFVLGTEMLATNLEYLHQSAFQQLDMAPLPFESERVNVFMVWHERSNNDPAHKWLRENVRSIVQSRAKANG